jgi:hypothetical protein
MVKLEKYESGRTAYMECDCGCGIMEIAYWEDEKPEWDDVSIQYYPLGFYAYQKVWLEKLKAIWKILTGKYYSLFTISISKEEFLDKIKYLLEE